jgi:multidrug efflux pump subunit AcrA (membrane-fusion protein)
MNMKKYVTLFTITVLVAGALFFCGKTVENSIPKVDVVTIRPITVDSTVSCSGRLEESFEHSIYAPASSYAKQVYVKVGDRITSGEKLADVVVSPDGSSEPYKSVNNYPEYIAPSGTGSGNGKTQSLTAPYDGTVTSISVSDSGDYVDPEKPMFQIQCSAGLQVRLEVDESQISDIRTGQPAQITGVGFKNSTYTGVVTSVSQQAKQLISTTGQETVVEVLVDVTKSGTDMKPGFSVQAAIQTSHDKNVLLAPYEVVKADKDGKEYVYRVNGRRVVKTYIETGKEYDGGFEILKGLSTNDRVVINQDSLPNGLYVIPKEAKAVSSDA